MRFSCKFFKATLDWFIKHKQIINYCMCTCIIKTCCISKLTCVLLMCRCLQMQLGHKNLYDTNALKN